MDTFAVVILIANLLAVNSFFFHLEAPGTNLSDEETPVDRARRDVDPEDYQIDTYGHPCHAFTKLNQPERRVSNRISELTADALCDRALKRRWYRFEGPAGGTMPEKCVEEFSCGTHAPIWMDGNHPTRYGQVVDRTVCMSLAGNCCQRRWYIRVANCGDFYSYLLPDTPGCFMAYCAGTEEACPEGLSSPTGYTPGCSDNFPDLRGSARLTMEGAGHEVHFYCDFEGPMPSNAVIDVDWFVDGPTSGRGSAGLYPIWTDTMKGRRRSILTEGRWMGKIGSDIYCKMRAKWDDRTGVPSPAILSDKYFAGIKIMKTTIKVSESGEEAVIQMQPTVPIKCLPQFDETCKVTVELGHDTNWQDKKCVDGSMRQIVFGDCTVDFTPDNWNQVQNVSVKAVRDFYTDGNKKMSVNFKPTYSTLTSPLWNSYQLPDVEVLAADAPTKMCSSTGDPHYNTFDGLYYHVYLEGEFVMYKHKRLPIQINTRLEKCGKVVSCNCAVAVMAGDDVIVIDRCNRRKRNLAFGKSFPNGWKTLHRHALQQGDSFTDGLKIYEYDGGKRYTVHLPTGAYLEFQVGQHWINLFLYASSDDWMATSGLCGTFDGNKTNDFTHQNGFTLNKAEDRLACGDSQMVCDFAQSWRVPSNESFFKSIVDVALSDQPFFSEHQFCKCEKHGDSSKIVCNYNYDIQNCQAMKAQTEGVDKTSNIIVKSRTSRTTSSLDSHSSRRKRRSIEVEEEERMEDFESDELDYFDMEFEFDEDFVGNVPSWPTPRGITEHYARSYCQNAILQSNAAAVCGRQIMDQVDVITDACMTDIKVTDDLTWALASLETFISECINEINDKASLWEIQSSQPVNEEEVEGPVTVADQLLAQVCPNDCSKQGVCNQGKCECQYGLTGRDCSTRIMQIPKIMHVSGEGLCDVRKRPCKRIGIFGEGFVNSTYLRCQFTKAKTGEVIDIKADFETFEEIACPMPDHGVTFNGDPSSKPGRSYEAYFLSVYQGIYYTPKIPVAVYNSACQTCTVNGYPSCKKLDDCCVINGHCYADGETHPTQCCRECNVAESTDSFSSKSSSSAEFYPQQKSYTVATGTPFKLSVHAKHSKSCHWTYNVDATSPASSVIRTNENGVHIELDTAQKEAHYFNVEATDECGHTLTDTYNLFVLPEGVIPGFEESGAEEHYRDCTDNHAPIFPRDSVSLSVVFDELLPLDFLAEDEDENDEIKYYVLQSTRGIVVSRNGKLSYRAPAEEKEEVITLIAEDECGGLDHMKIFVAVMKCPCRHGRQCVIKDNMPRGNMNYDCV